MPLSFLLSLGRRCLLCGAVLLGPAGAAPAAPLALRVAAQEGTEPKFIGAERGGAIAGLCIDIFRAIEKIDPGLAFVGDQRWMPLIRIYSELASGGQDAACAVQHTAERDAKFLFLDPPLFPIAYHLLARVDDDVVVNDWDDVRRLGGNGVVLANRGFATTTVLEQLGGLQIDASSTSPPMNLHKLIAGRGRLFLHRSPGLRAFLKRNGAAGKVKILPVVMETAPLYLAVGKHVDPGQVARLRHALQLLERRGELERLLRKWDQ
ncbi:MULTISPECIES: substrate-binding periplasmic protein [Rugamonas]|uniref:Amino acid ABC transporter substrate-binding protein, PAAT family (TC 3.A.1.3.-) n=1 Tax=Rugamonas rubra TaxID=758825 RepID=A0A1I4JNE0_9BURK|nr:MULTISPECIES: transporter substrate-binding domain-containing protein [Rugamonas]WGG51578.1 transporter substrate-binding domain-containing protein [Rugamonas sp. DEMB1]SFL67811.1 amino acid ABC transporter substrate-binding protein, PAAT family (TC 3.A.1.3.-) [Rugamonas rubra]